MDKKYEAMGNIDDKVIEECSEVIHAICKAKRFGIEDWHPNTPKICNARLILNEIDDLKRRLNAYEPFLKILAERFEEVKHE